MKRIWYLVAACAAALGLLLGVAAIFSGNFSARGYVEDRYTRAPERDIDDGARAYTSPRAPSQVAADLTGEWEPAAQHVDGSGIYLRYADDAIVLLPIAVTGGTLILVERLSTAYPRYVGIVGGGWIGQRGNPGRGGGPGTGK